MKKKPLWGPGKPHKSLLKTTPPKKSSCQKVFKLLLMSLKQTCSMLIKFADDTNLGSAVNSDVCADCNQMSSRSARLYVQRLITRTYGRNWDLINWNPIKKERLSWSNQLQDAHELLVGYGTGKGKCFFLQVSSSFCHIPTAYTPNSTSRKGQGTQREPSQTFAKCHASNRYFRRKKANILQGKQSLFFQKF